MQQKKEEILWRRDIGYNVAAVKHVTDKKINKKYRICGFFTQLCEKSPDLNLDKTK